MKKLCAFFIAIAIIYALPFAANAEEEKIWGVNTSVGFYTDYVFRGKAVYDATSIQPSVTAYIDIGDFSTLSANAWSHLSAETDEPPEKFTELDYTISYDIYIDRFTLSVGHIFYTFPGDTQRIADTVEYYAGISVDMILNPTFTFYNDYDEGEYQYYTATVSETLPIPILGDDFEFTPYATFAFASNADDGPVFYDEDGLVHIDAGGSFDLEMGIVTFSPNFTFTFETDDAVRNEFWMGIDLSVDI